MAKAKIRPLQDRLIVERIEGEEIRPPLEDISSRKDAAPPCNPGSE